MIATRSAISATFVVAFAAVALGCTPKSAGPTGSSSGAASASAAPPASGVSVIDAIPVPMEKVRAAVNADNQPVYKGPTGSVHGVITVKGDQPPLSSDIAEKIPDKCKDARLFYGRLFREGMVRSLGDALVTVSEYKGFVPAHDIAVRLQAKDCTYGTRTVAMTYGQRLEVQSKDGQSYVPRLFGSTMEAEMVATPGGSPVNLYPQAPGRFRLVDSMHIFMTADVFVLKYPTAAVTGLDGKYEIKGIPVGEVTVSALLPATMQVAQQSKVQIEADKSVEVNLEINFDAKTMSPPAPDAGAAQKKKPEVH